MKLSERWKTLALGLFIAAITWLVFGQTLRHGFVNLDDYEYVVKNPEVTQGLTWSGVAWAFTHVRAANWHPLTWVSHMLDCQLYGLNPAGHHLTNVLLHTGTAIALFLVLRRMTGFLWRSAFVATVFAIHPLRVESVAWIAERKDVLSGLFFVLCLGGYAGYVRRPSFLRYAMVFSSLLLGLLSKPMLVTLPLVLLLLDYWPLHRLTHVRTLPQLLLEKLPLFALVAASCAATLIAQKITVQPIDNLLLPLRVENAMLSYVAYLRQMVWPSDLAVLYPLAPNTIAPLSVLLSTVLLLAVKETRLEGASWADLTMAVTL